jgi:hypothetical protein
MNHPTVTPKKSSWNVEQIIEVMKEVFNTHKYCMVKRNESLVVFRDLTPVEKDVLASRMGEVRFESLNNGTRIIPIN